MMMKVDDHDRDDDRAEDDVLEASPLLSTKVNQNSNLASLGKYCCMTFPASLVPVLLSGNMKHLLP